MSRIYVEYLAERLHELLSYDIDYVNFSTTKTEGDACVSLDDGGWLWFSIPDRILLDNRLLEQFKEDFIENGYWEYWGGGDRSVGLKLGGK